jgi:hypothetical protein
MKKPAPVRVSRAQDAVDDRKAGLHTAQWTLHFTKLSLVVMVVTLVVTVTGIGVSIYYATRQPARPVEPGTLVIVRPDIGLGGAEVLPIPGQSAPVDYLRAGAQLKVDCFREVEDKYGFAHISGYFETDRWIDSTELALPQGGEAAATIGKLGPCKS